MEDCHDHDLIWLTNTSVDGCKDACDMIEYCAGFTYIANEQRDPRAGSYGCLLKSDSCDAAEGDCDWNRNHCFFRRDRKRECETGTIDIFSIDYGMENF